VTTQLYLLAALVALLVGLAVGKAWERYKLRDGRWIDRRRLRETPHYMLGLNFLIDNQVDQAIDELTLATSTDTDALEIQMILGNLYRQKGQVGRAINVHQALLQRPDLTKLEQAYAIAVEQKDTRRIINIAKLLGNYFFQLESSAKAMDYYLDALGLAQETGDRPTECSLLLAVGNVQIQGEEYELAVANLEKGLNLASALEDAGNQISALVGLMKAKAYTNNMGLAQIYGDQALSIAGHIQDADIEFSIIESVVGLLFSHDEFEAAIPKLKRGVDLAEEKQDGSQKLNMLMGQAFASYQLGDSAQAEALYQQLLAEAEHLQDQVTESTALGRLSAIYSEQGDVEKGLDYAQKALEKAHQTENVGLVGEQQLLIALTQRDLGKHAKAEAYFADAKKSYQAIGNDELVDYIDELVAGETGEAEAG